MRSNYSNTQIKNRKSIRESFYLQNINAQKSEEDQYIDEKQLQNIPFFCIREEYASELRHRSIVALRYKSILPDRGFYHGSGVLLSSNIILTSAHNIYDKGKQREYQKEGYQIFVGVNGQVEDYHEVLNWIYPEQYKTCNISNKLQHDYAVIKLKPNLQRPIIYDSFMQLSLPCECIINKLPHIKLDIYGYPTRYKDNYQPLNRQLTKLRLHQYGFTLSNSIHEVDPKQYKITYKVNTQKGQSGCPIVVDNRIIALHNGAGKNNDEWNMGRLVTIDLIQNIKVWIKQLNENNVSLFEKVTCLHQIQMRIPLKLQNDILLEEPKQINNSSIWIREQSKEMIKQRKKAKSVVEKQSKYGQKQENSMIAIKIAEAKQIQGIAHKLNEDQKYELALEQYKRIIAIYENLEGKNSLKIAKILVYCIGDIFLIQGKYSAALQSFQKGRQIYKKKGEKENYNIAASLQNIGIVHHNMADYDKALGKYRKALFLWQKTSGKESIEAGRTINSIGLVCLEKRQYALALQQFERSLQIAEKAGKGESIDAAYIHNNIGTVYSIRKEYSLAMQHYERSLAIKQTLSGKDSIFAAGIMINIGLAYNYQKDYPRAIDIYQRSISIYQTYQLRHRQYADAFLNMGLAYSCMNDYRAATEAYRTSLHIYEQMDLKDWVKESSLQMARCLKKSGEIGQLQKMFQKYEWLCSNL